VIEEKIFVAKWMGWKQDPESSYDVWIKSDYHPQGVFLISEWSPQDNDCPCSVWHDIFERMDDIMFNGYYLNLIGLSKGLSNRKLHTARNDIRWKALNLMLGEIMEDEVSDCCGAMIYEETDICSRCKEHCGVQDED